MHLPQLPVTCKQFNNHYTSYLRLSSYLSIKITMYIIIMIFIVICCYPMGFLSGSVVKNLPATTGDAEKAMASHSSTLAWKIPWTEEPGRLHSKGLWRVRHDWVTSLSLFTFMHNGSPLQCSCLENPRDGRAWWAAI